MGQAARIIAPLVLAPLATEQSKKLGRWYDGENGFNAANENTRTSITDPLPQKTPSPPPPKLDDKTEFPATPPNIPELEGRPINEILKNDPVIFQAMHDDVIREFQRPLHSNRGDEWTVKGNTIIATEILPKALAKYGPKKSASYRHIGGANDKDGNSLKEQHRRNIETGGLAGSSNPDITAEIDGDIHDFNTGDVLQDGRTGIARERRSFANLAKNVGTGLAGFLPKLRPGMDPEEWYERTLRLVEEYLERAYGPPRK